MRQRGARGRVHPWARVLAYGVLPALALVWPGAGFLKWQDGSARLSQEAAREVGAGRHRKHHRNAFLPARHGREGPDRRGDRLTGSFRDDYTS